VGGFASEPVFGPVRLELWQILTFWFFWVKACPDHFGAKRTKKKRSPNKFRNDDQSVKVKRPFGDKQE
jgi:hypothetical protein